MNGACQEESRQDGQRTEFPAMFDMDEIAKGNALYNIEQCSLCLASHDIKTNPFKNMS